jgi:hypothetical protein
MASSAAFANEAVPTPHNVIRCVINGDIHKTLIFAYDQQGKTSQQDRPGFCLLDVDYQGNPFGSYFCWVAETQTSPTTEGQLAVQFVQHLGDGAKLYTQINIPARPQAVFAGTMRYLFRSAKDLRVPIPPRDAMKLDCRAEKLMFNNNAVTR